jgi:hypothetical protein
MRSARLRERSASFSVISPAPMEPACSSLGNMRFAVLETRRLSNVGFGQSKARLSDDVATRAKAAQARLSHRKKTHQIVADRSGEPR